MKSSMNNIEEPITITKPKFIFSMSLLKAIPLGMFFGIFGGIGVLMAFLIMSGQSTTGEVDPIVTSMFVVGAGGCFIVSIVLYLWYRKTALNHIEYRIFSNRIEYFEGFFTVEQKTVNFADLSEIYLRKGMVQKRYNVGTIMLMTKGFVLPMIGMSRSMGGMLLRDIPNPDSIYKQLKQLKDSS